MRAPPGRGHGPQPSRAQSPIERLEFWFAKLATKDWVQGAIRRLYRDTLPEIVRRGGHWGAHGTR